MSDENPAGSGSREGQLQRRSLRDGPTDGITRLAYLSPTLLVSASWDGCVRVHDTLRDTLVAMKSLNSPVLSLAVPAPRNDASSSRTGDDGGSGNPCVFAGTLDGSIYRLDVEGATTTPGDSARKLRATLVGRHSHDNAPSSSSTSTSTAVSCLAAIETTVMVGVPPADDEPPVETEEGEEDENAEPRTLCVVAAAGWDRRFTLWDGGGGTSSASPSASSSDTTSTNNNNKLCEVLLPGKAFAMDSCGVSRGALPLESTVFRCVVATSGRRICVIDTPLPTSATRRPGEDENDDPALSSFSMVLPDISAKLVLDRESSLKYQTRTVKFFPDGSGIAVSSIEGRVAIEYLTELGVAPHPDSGGGKKYAFKCHRKNELVYPVNCVEFHRDYPCVFVTGGAEGTTVLWDGFARKKLAALGPDCDTSVSALALHPCGTELAIASSYTYERGGGDGDSELSKGNEIYIRALRPDEFQPKK